MNDETIHFIGWEELYIGYREWCRCIRHHHHHQESVHVEWLDLHVRNFNYHLILYFIDSYKFHHMRWVNVSFLWTQRKCTIGFLITIIDHLMARKREPFAFSFIEMTGRQTNRIIIKRLNDQMIFSSACWMKYLNAKIHPTLTVRSDVLHWTGHSLTFNISNAINVINKRVYFIRFQLFSTRN